jgi:hypothetical protein
MTCSAPFSAGDGLGFICRVHGQEFNSFRRRTQSKTLRDFHLRPREEFLYTCGAIDLCEWEVPASESARSGRGKPVSGGLPDVSPGPESREQMLYFRRAEAFCATLGTRSFYAC